MDNQIYLYVALGSTTIFVVKLLMMLIIGDGGDTDLDGDFSDDLDGSESFELITVQSVMTFLMIFGWTALALRNDMKMSQINTLLISSLGALAGSYVFSLAVFKLKKLTTKEVQDLEIEVGSQVVVYSNIPKKGEGYGQVKVELKGSLQYLNAYTDDSNEIKTGSSVKVIKSKPLTVTKENTK